jgi:hypothetical protein
MTATVYRFLPWSRRGLAAALPGGAPDATPMPSRAAVDIGVVVSGITNAVATSVTLYGPGDVIGLDPTVIVRTTPRANVTDVEPNYLATVDFDQPELPWLFTPTGARASGRIPPWLVLVVVEDRPGVSVTVPRGAPLPQLSIQSGAVAELPDLADSWAWAHAQLLDSDDGGGSPADIATALRDRPDHNVSRLVCPRHLRPNASWIAAVVPAYDAGRIRGMGGEPTADALGPSWGNDDTATLPVYFHWTFTTGPAGDFESLARRLHPFAVDSAVGHIKMHVGAAAPPMELPENDTARFLDMDGALMAPTDVPGTLADVDQRLRIGLRSLSALVADAADGQLDGHADPTPTSAQPVGPPVYGQYARRSRIVGDPEPAVWFDEVNTDPRGRVAAGLGAEVLRANQEDVVSAAWDQVGDVLAAQAALSRARLGLEAARRFHERHVIPQSPERLLAFAAPLAARALLGLVTVERAVAESSLPDAVLDGALRRQLSPGSRLMTRAMRRVGDGATASGQFVARLADGRATVDPTKFSWIAIDGFAVSAVTSHGDGMSDFAGLGLALTAPDAQVQRLRSDLAAVSATPAPAQGSALTVRSDLAQVGLVTSAQLSAARTAARTAIAENATATSLSTGTLAVLSQVVEASVASPSSAGIQIDLSQVAVQGPVLVHGVSIRSTGDIEISHGTTGATTRVGRVAPSLIRNSTPRDIVTSLTLNALPAPSAPANNSVLLNATSAVGRIGVTVPTTGVTVAGAAPVSTNLMTLTVPRLTTDFVVLSTFTTAFQTATAGSIIDVVEPSRTFVGLDLAAASGALTARSNPESSHVSRRDAMISFAGEPVGRIAANGVALRGWLTPPAADRVMAFPHFDRGAYEMLAAFDRNRFCPGIDEVPPDSVTLLRTNPRFIAAFLAGLNQETARELMWRRYPTDQRGTPFQRFWSRLDGKTDVPPMHQWGNADLADQTADPKGALALLVRGQLLRRYPNAIVVAIPAIGPRTPSADPAAVKAPVLAGRFDPDVSFFGFDLLPADAIGDPGWFFALMEPPTEPRFGLDETSSSEHPQKWDDVAWGNLPDAAPGKHVTSTMLRNLSIAPLVLRADQTATALFQRPFKLVVHARHLVKEPS